MGLGISNKNTGEEFLPVFKFNAVSGDAVIASSEKNSSGEYEKSEKEVSFPVKFIFDFANIEVGWMEFTATGPSFALVKLGERMPAKPSDTHKQGFRIKLYNKEFGLSYFSNSSKTIGEVMDTLHDQYLRDEKSNAGKVPVVEIKGVKKVSVKTKEGSKNYKQPDWSIVSWVVRPEAMTEKAKEVIKEEVISNDDF